MDTAVIERSRSQMSPKTAPQPVASGMAPLHRRTSPGLLPAAESRLYFFQGIEVFLQPADMLLHLDNR